MLCLRGLADGVLEQIDDGELVQLVKFFNVADGFFCDGHFPGQVRRLLSLPALPQLIPLGRILPALLMLPRVNAQAVGRQQPLPAGLHQMRLVLGTGNHPSGGVCVIDPAFVFQPVAPVVLISFAHHGTAKSRQRGIESGGESIPLRGARWQAEIRHDWVFLGSVWIDFVGRFEGGLCPGPAIQSGGSVDVIANVS